MNIEEGVGVVQHEWNGLIPSRNICEGNTICDQIKIQTVLFYVCVWVLVVQYLVDRLIRSLRQADSLPA